MAFHLNYIPKPSSTKIDHTQAIMLVGSCFADNIGALFQKHYFKTLINPNGVLFNPKSIYHSLINCLENKETDDAFILKRNELFFSYLHHSSIFNVDQNKLKFELNSLQTKATDFLKQADHLIITFGTAFTYKHKLLATTVANCHKQPGSDFEKTLLTVDEIVKDHSELITKLKKVNPDLNILYTVSPVKYLKDGIEENNISKATLLLAVNQLCKLTNCSYFPAYELVNDDLRDYRFYKEDMAHPNEQAVQYIWNKFSDAFFSADTKQLNQELYSIYNSENHTLLFPESIEAKKFTSALEKKKKELKEKYPFLEI